VISTVGGIQLNHCANEWSEVGIGAIFTEQIFS